MKITPTNILWDKTSALTPGPNVVLSVLIETSKLNRLKGL